MPNSGHIIIRSGARSTGRAQTYEELKRNKLESRPEHDAMQRAKLATREERARNGINAMVRAECDSERQQGREPSESKIRAEVQKVADRAEAKRGK